MSFLLLMAVYKRLIGIAAGIFTAVSLIPQLVKIVKEKHGDDVSISMLLILLGGLILWICYGYLIKDWPLIVTNSFSLLFNILIIILKAYHKKRKLKPKTAGYR